MPVKICEVTALSCTSAGIERGSEAGTRRWPAKVKLDGDRGLRLDLGAELVERCAPFDADGRDRRASGILPPKAACAAEEREQQRLPANDVSEAGQPSLLNASPPGAVPRAIAREQS